MGTAFPEFFCFGKVGDSAFVKASVIIDLRQADSLQGHQQGQHVDFGK
jgi:hypothetical protein